MNSIIIMGLLCGTVLAVSAMIMCVSIYRLRTEEKKHRGLFELECCYDSINCTVNRIENDVEKLIKNANIEYGDVEAG